MRLILTAALICAVTAAMAQDGPAAEAALPDGVTVNTSYNISGPMAAKSAADEAVEDQQYRTQLYVLSAKECADMLASIAKSCSIVNISVSTQITRQPGIATQMYATGNVSMLVELK